MRGTTGLYIMNMKPLLSGTCFADYIGYATQSTPQNAEA